MKEIQPKFSITPYQKFYYLWHANTKIIDQVSNPIIFGVSILIASTFINPYPALITAAVSLSIFFIFFIFFIIFQNIIASKICKAKTKNIFKIQKKIFSYTEILDGITNIIILFLMIPISLLAAHMLKLPLFSVGLLSNLSVMSIASLLALPIFGIKLVIEAVAKKYLKK